jgi:hypothetical protein
MAPIGVLAGAAVLVAAEVVAELTTSTGVGE